MSFFFDKLTQDPKYVKQNKMLQFWELVFLCLDFCLLFWCWYHLHDQNVNVWSQTKWQKKNVFKMTSLFQKKERGLSWWMDISPVLVFNFIFSQHHRNYCLLELSLKIGKQAFKTKKHWKQPKLCNRCLIDVWKEQGQSRDNWARKE